MYNVLMCTVVCANQKRSIYIYIASQPLTTQAKQILNPNTQTEGANEVDKAQRSVWEMKGPVKTGGAD